MRLIQCRTPLPQGSIKGAVAWLYINQLIKLVINLILWPIMFSTNCLPTVKNTNRFRRTIEIIV
jgi:hypothetical protein